MIKDGLTINGVDMNAMGVFLEDGSISAFMAPPPLKDAAVSRSRLEHGQHAITNAKVDSREFTVAIHVNADTRQEFMSRHNALINILKAGNLDITTAFTGSDVFHCRYISCPQFSEFLFGIGKFSLRLVEDNPNDRSTHEQ